MPANHLETGVAFSPAPEAGQYLTFRVGREEYGIDILAVQEVKGLSAITPIPNAPRHLRGLMNLRGTILPVVDLGARFGMAPVEPGPLAVIVVVKLGRRLAGLLVDAVSDVLGFAASDVTAAPDLGSDLDLAFIRGIAQAGDHLVTLLEIDRVLGSAELPAAPDGG